MCNKILKSGANCRNREDSDGWCRLHNPKRIKAREEHEDRARADQINDCKVGRHIRTKFPEIYSQYLLDARGGQR